MNTALACTHARRKTIIIMHGILIVRSYVPYWSIEPDIENFILVSFEWYRGAPFQITCDAARLESVPHP